MVQTLAFIIFNDIAMRGAESVDSTAYIIGVLFSDNTADISEGRWIARTHIAELLERKIAVLDERNLIASPAVHQWITGGNPLLAPGLHEHTVRIHFTKKAIAEAEKKVALQKPPPPITPQSLYNQLREYVISNDDACRQLAVRGYLHLQRREILQANKDAGSNECILIMGESGSGKTYMVERFGQICSLPFASMSASAFSSTGYVGLDPDDAIKTLIKNAGDPKASSSIEKARYGVLFMDEWDKRRSHSDTGLDVTGCQIQYEFLRMMQGTKIILGARRNEREESPVEFNSNGTCFCFAGAFTGLPDIIRRLSKNKSGMGFGNAISLKQSPKIYDALLDYGMVAEFLNRISAIITMKRPEYADIIKIATSPHGDIQTYNRILEKQGLTIAIDQKGLEEIAAFSVESKIYARGIRLVVSALVEDLVFIAAKGNAVLSVKDVSRAIGRISNCESPRTSD